MTLAEAPVKVGRSNLVSDLIAGLTTALVTIPDGMASAILAGVNPLNGLYALMVGTPVAALLASSQFMFVANIGAIAITVNSVLHDVSSSQILGALATLTILVGRDVWDTGRGPRGILLFTFIMTLTLPVQWAVLLGVILAMGQFIYQSSTDIGVTELVMQADGMFVEREEPDRLAPNSIVLLEPYGSLYFAGAHSLESHLPDPRGAQAATVILRLRDVRQAGSTLVSVLERYAKKLHGNGAPLVLTELSDKVYDQLTRTETIELIGIDRAYRAEREVFSATRRALRDLQKQP